MTSRFALGLQHVAGLALTLVFVLPLFWVITASLRQPGLPPPTTVEWWPADAHWDNYLEVFRIVPLGRYILNSLLVVAVAVPATLVTASAAGFGLSQLADPWRRRLFVASVVVLMVPGMAVWLFRFHLLRWVGLQDTLWALIVPAFAASSPLFVLLFYWTFWREPAVVALPYKSYVTPRSSVVRLAGEEAARTTFPAHASGLPTVSVLDATASPAARSENGITVACQTSPVVVVLEWTPAGPAYN